MACIVSFVGTIIATWRKSEFRGIYRAILDDSNFAALNILELLIFVSQDLLVQNLTCEGEKEKL